MNHSQVLTIPDEYSKVFAVDKSAYRSLPLLTKYEFDQVIGLRTMHLSRGAPPMVELPPDFKVESNIQLRELAQRELLERRLPYMIKRVMPNGKSEYWSLEQLDLTAVQHLIRR
jgi:DNA-directed RNA polymerase I, II, and III subunit RPABC2